MEVEVLIASCCTPNEVRQKLVSVIEGMKEEVPDLNWKVIDITEQPELAVKYRAPMTPAIVVDGKLQLMGYPKKSVLEAKLRECTHR